MDDESIFRNNTQLLSYLVLFAPEANVRIALMSLIEFLEGISEGVVVDRDELFEVVAQCLAWMHHHVGDTGITHEEDATAYDGLSPEEVIERFREQLGE